MSRGRHSGILSLLIPWLLSQTQVRAYETWHLVDVSAVMCPLPEGGTCPEETCGPAPDPTDYAIGLEQSPTMTMDAPHVISFLRTSDQEVTITFEVLDNAGSVVAAETTVTLQGFDGAVDPATCSCTGQSLPADAQATYGASYGTSCSDWDNANCDQWNGDLVLGDWCCDKWCYADAACPDALASAIASTSSQVVYFSYQVCNPQPTANCSWNDYRPPSPCECRNVGSLMNATTLASFGSSYGATCQTWDLTDCHLKFNPDQLDQWCCDQWCYVDGACEFAYDSYLQPGELYWANIGVCESDPAVSAQCPYVPTTEVDAAAYAACACLGESPTPELAPLGAPLEYGGSCDTWDLVNCTDYYPDSLYDLWCCETWCYVNETCPGRSESFFWPGHYYSTTGCLDAPTGSSTVYAYTWEAADALSGCPHSTACDCADLNPGVDTSTYGAAYGKQCAAHDATDCSGFWSSESSLWTGTKDWCCDSWCYVNESCPLADPSFFQGALPFSYATCDDTGNQNYNEGSNTCEARRLAPAPPAFRGEAQQQQQKRHQIAATRRLSSRRRSSYSSYSSPRRRAPSRRRRSSPPRRRRASSYSAPSPPSRRRTPSPTRRRRTPPRRRRTPVPAPPPDRRRRELRRRTTSATAPRRRGIPQPSINGQPYGYGDTNYMYSNYNGVPPQTTSYGYSGQNAYSSGSSSNMALYAAGGAVAGAGVGAGATYMYYSRYDYSGGGYDYFGRRRIYGYSQYSTEWCLEPEGSRRMMECSSCNARYGFNRCSRADSCYDGSGCTYTTGASYNRDDVEGAVFLPHEWQWPLKVRITSITSASYDPNTICPPTTEAALSLAGYYDKEMTLNADLYLTVTQMDVLNGGEGSECVRDTGLECVPNGLPCYNYQFCTDNGESFTCVCQQGYCAADGDICLKGLGASTAPLSVGRTSTVVMALVAVFSSYAFAFR